MNDRKFLDHYREAIRLVDQTLEWPVRSLISLGRDSLGDSGKPLYFPRWVSEGYVPPHEEKNRLTPALCCVTLQKVWRLRRRFAWLEKDLEELNLVKESVAESYLPLFPANSLGPLSLADYAKHLQSESFGALNPY